MPIYAGNPLGTSIENSEITTGTITSDKLAFGVFEKIAKTTLTTASNTVNFSGLDINTDGAYVLFFLIKNATANFMDAHLYINNDTTATNYYRQVFQADNTTMTASRSNTAIFTGCNASSCSQGIVYIFRDYDGYFRAIAETNYMLASALRLNLNALSKTATVTNITDINLIADTDADFGAGSKFVLYKVKL